MPKPKLYHNRIDALTTRKQWLAILAYAKQHKLKLGEAIRDLISLGILTASVLAKMDKQIGTYAKAEGLHWSQAIRELVNKGLDRQ